MPIIVKGTVVPYLYSAHLSGQKASYMGGKEIYLSKEEGVGPCLCVPKGKHTRKFPVTKDVVVYDAQVKEGKLSVELPYLGNRVQLQIATEDDLPQLLELHRVLRSRKLLASVGHVSRVKKLGSNGLRGTRGVGLKDDDHSGDEDAEVGDVYQSSSRALQEAYLEQETSLSEEQLAVLRHIKDGRNVFFTGCAGTGKTYLIKEIVKFTDPNSTFVTASTGISAVEVGGMNLHSFAGIGLGDGDASAWIDKVARSERHLKYWRACRTLIIDEISMVDADMLDKLDEVARAIRRAPGRPFGGIQLFLSGDLLQLPPVNKNRQAKFAFQGTAWGKLELATVLLTKVYRQADEAFVRILNDVRFGRMTPEVQAALKGCVGRPLDDDDGIVPTKIRALNKDVEEENHAQLDRLSGRSKVFTARDEGKDTFVKILQTNSLLPMRLEIKVGAQVMLLKNLPAQRLHNGSRGVVIGFSKSDYPVVRFSSGAEAAVEMDVQTLQVNRQTVATRHQVPLKLAWSLMVHKCQGMEIDKLELSLDRSIFDYGQAYTALSRARSLEGLKLTAFHPECIRANPAVVEFYERHAKHYVPVRPQIPISEVGAGPPEEAASDADGAEGGDSDEDEDEGGDSDEDGDEGDGGRGEGAGPGEADAAASGSGVGDLMAVAEADVPPVEDDDGAGDASSTSEEEPASMVSQDLAQSLKRSSPRESPSTVLSLDLLAEPPAVPAPEPKAKKRKTAAGPVRRLHRTVSAEDEDDELFT